MCKSMKRHESKHATSTSNLTITRKNTKNTMAAQLRGGRLIQVFMTRFPLRRLGLDVFEIGYSFVHSLGRAGIGNLGLRAFELA